MALTKSNEAVDEWAEVAQNTVREGAEKDISPNYETLLHIAVALSAAVAHTGTEIIVQVSADAAGDEGWRTLDRWIGPTGIAVKADFGGDEAAAQTVLSITDPETAGVDNDGKFKFVEHGATVADCEIVFQVANSGDAGDTVTVQDGLTNAQTAADSDLWDIDDAEAEAVGQYVIVLPFGESRVRMLYNNKHDPDGATVHTMCRLSKVTAVT